MREGPTSPEDVFLNCPFDDRPLQREKRLLIFDKEKYRYQKFISDIAGMDIHAHGGDPETALVITRNWLTNVSRRQLPGEKRLLSIFRQFRGDLPALAEKLDLDPAKISYADFERMVAGWLLNARPPSKGMAAAVNQYAGAARH